MQFSIVSCYIFKLRIIKKMVMMKKCWEPLLYIVYRLWCENNTLIKPRLKTDHNKNKLMNSEIH